MTPRVIVAAEPVTRLVIEPPTLLRMLEMPRSNLYKKIEKYELVREEAGS